MKKITINELETSINSAERVILEFSAEWCGPCRMVKPILNEISAETDIAVFEIDVDEQIELAEKYGIRNIPTTLYYKNGTMISRTVGANPKSRILEQFNREIQLEND